MARTRTATPVPAPERAPTVNPRTARSQERLAEAAELLSKELASGEWVSSNEIHRRLGKTVSEGMFGRAKQALGIEHRRVKPEEGARRSTSGGSPRRRSSATQYTGSPRRIGLFVRIPLRRHDRRPMLQPAAT